MGAVGGVSTAVINTATGEIVEAPKTDDKDYRIRDLEDQVAGLEETIRKQARTIGALQRRVMEEEDPNAHPKGKKIVGAIERWKRGTGHEKAKVSADRVKLVKARLKDGYELDSEEWLPDEPTIELAIDGICAFPYVVNGQRKRTGKPSQRHDKLKTALGGGEDLERFARLGWQARKEGWVTWHE